MRIVRQSEICQGVPDRWAKQYAKSATAWHGEITARLSLLSPQDRTPDTIDAIIGNGTWTANFCDECGMDQSVSVHLGEEPDYEARYLNLCLSCLRDAAKMAEDAALSPNLDP